MEILYNFWFAYSIVFGLVVIGNWYNMFLGLINGNRRKVEWSFIAQIVHKVSQIIILALILTVYFNPSY